MLIGGSEFHFDIEQLALESAFLVLFKIRSDLNLLMCFFEDGFRWLDGIDKGVFLFKTHKVLLFSLFILFLLILSRSAFKTIKKVETGTDIHNLIF